MQTLCFGWSPRCHNNTTMQYCLYAPDTQTVFCVFLSFFLTCVWKKILNLKEITKIYRLYWSIQLFVILETLCAVCFYRNKVCITQEIEVLCYFLTTILILNPDLLHGCGFSIQTFMYCIFIWYFKIFRYESWQVHLTSINGLPENPLICQ